MFSLAKMLARESKAAMERDAADVLARANEENLRRQEEMQRQQEEELAEQRRLLDEHQEHLRKEAEIARCDGGPARLRTTCVHFTAFPPFDSLQEIHPHPRISVLASTVVLPISNAYYHLSLVEIFQREKGVVPDPTRQA